MLVTVASFREPWEAHLFRGRLEAEGLMAFVSFDQHIGNKWIISDALGGAKVQVSSDDLEWARDIANECRAGVFKEELAAELGDLDDPACPHCGGTEFRRRRPFPRAALALTLSLMTGTVLPPVGWMLRCESCQKEYRAPHRPVSAAKIVLTATVMVAAGLATVAILHWLEKVFGCNYNCLIR